MSGFFVYSSIMYYGCIYGLRSPSGKWYIGQTTQVSPDKYIREQYKYSLGSGRPKIGNALSKYGFDSFEVSIFVYLMDRDSLDKAEVGFIEMYNSIENGYNCKEGGHHGGHTKDTRENMSISQRSRVRTEEEISHCRKLGLESKNRFVSKETKSKISYAGKNRFVSEETREKKRQKMLGRTYSDRSLFLMKKSAEMYIYEIEGPDNCIYETTNLKQLCKILNISQGNMASRGHTNGYRIFSKFPL